MAKKTILNKRLHIYYSGSVHGVGFRYTAERIADSLKLTGWVRNLSDGRVEVVCEGPEPDILIFIQKVNDTFSGYIRDADMEWGDAMDEFIGFDIKF